MNPRSLIQSLAQQFDAEDNAAHDLWGWLPSHAAAERHLGDYADNVQPGIEEIMTETMLLLANLHGHHHKKAEIIDWFYCCCDDIENAPTDDEKLEHIHNWFQDQGWQLIVKPS